MTAPIRFRWLAAVANWLTAVRAGKYRQVIGVGLVIAGLSAAVGFLTGYRVGGET